MRITIPSGVTCIHYSRTVFDKSTSSMFDKVEVLVHRTTVHFERDLQVSQGREVVIIRACDGYGIGLGDIFTLTGSVQDNQGSEERTLWYAHRQGFTLPVLIGEAGIDFAAIVLTE